MKKHAADIEKPDRSTEKASRIASVLSIALIFSSTLCYFLLAFKMGTVSKNLTTHAKGFAELKFDTERKLYSVEDQHLRTSRQAWKSQMRMRNNNGRGRSHLEEPRVCDCMVIHCPRGPRGPPGDDGSFPNDGHPGDPGKDGVDGIYQVDEPECPPCHPGPPGEDGVRGERGEQGRAGTPGETGRAGVNEPGSIGLPGARGQSGRPGTKGDTGEAGQDFVQLAGLPGPKGAPGSIGLPGARGDPGNNGKPAPPGPEGFPGPVGEPGDEGDYGLRGLPGRKGPPGADGGYCQCPPREGAPFRQNTKISITNKNIRRNGQDFDDYDVAVTQKIRPSNFNHQTWKNRRPPQKNMYHNLRKTTDLIDPGVSSARRSPLAPLIAYKDSREEGHKNRIVMRSNTRGQEGSSLDFELR